MAPGAEMSPSCQGRHQGKEPGIDAMTLGSQREFQSRGETEIIGGSVEIEGPGWHLEDGWARFRSPVLRDTSLDPTLGDRLELQNFTGTPWNRSSQLLTQAPHVFLEPNHICPNPAGKPQRKQVDQLV